MSDIENRQIRRAILGLAVPASLEAVFQVSLGLVDQVIIGRLGEASLAAVGLTNQIMFLATLVLGTVASSTAILVAQYEGKGDRDGASTVASAALLIGTIVGLAVSLLPAALPGATLRLLGAEEGVVDAGRVFFRVVILTLPISLAGTIAASVLRSLWDSKTPMAITLGAVSVNTLLNFMLVFGLGPVPALGAPGSAYATFVSQVLRAGVLIYCVFLRNHPSAVKLKGPTESARRIIGEILVLTYPITLTDILWALGIFTYTILCVRLGTTEVVAIQIINTIEAVFIVCSSGLAVAGLTLVGQAIGAGDLRVMQARARQLILITLGSSALFGALVVLSSLVAHVFYPVVGVDALRLAVIGLVLNGLFQPAKVMNMVMANGVLRAGGDNKFVLFADIVSMYIIGVPLAFLLAFPLKMGLIGVLIGRLAEEVSRVIMLFARKRTSKWYRALTSGIGPSGAVGHGP